MKKSSLLFTFSLLLFTSLVAGVADAAFAERLNSDPWLVPDYNRDGRIDTLDPGRQSIGCAAFAGHDIEVI